VRYFAAVLLATLVAGGAAGQELTATLRGGIYADTDRTQVVRTLASVAAKLASAWTLPAP